MPNHVHPKKLLLSKWTAVSPVDREKHFLVTELVQPAQPEAPIEWIVLEAVMNQHQRCIPWRDLKNDGCWRQGWR